MTTILPARIGRRGAPALRWCSARPACCSRRVRAPRSSSPATTSGSPRTGSGRSCSPWARSTRPSWPSPPCCRETEFNLGVTRFVDKPLDATEAHYSGIFYVKRRLKQNEAGTAGWAVSVGTGIDPSHLEAGTVTDTFQSWFANTSYTIAVRRRRRDLGPDPGCHGEPGPGPDRPKGVGHDLVLAGRGLQGHPAVGHRRRGVRHRGEAYAEPSYRVGVRWESSRVVVAATYGNSFSGEREPAFRDRRVRPHEPAQDLLSRKVSKDPDW